MDIPSGQVTPLRIGTRGSGLAYWQAQWVASRLAEHGRPTELVVIETTGDRRRGPIATLGVQGVFTREIQHALLRREVDVAVHSLKDLPTEPVPGLMVACVPQRASAWDVLVTRDGASLDELSVGAQVGTSSHRRRAQLLAMRPDLQLVDLRGNVDTRLKRLDERRLDAVVLAAAGLERLGITQWPYRELRPPMMLPAAGQGALGLEIRADDTAASDALRPLADPATATAVWAERAVLAGLRAGCLAPVGTWGRIEEAGQLVLDAVVLNQDGSRRLQAAQTGSADDPEALGQAVAQMLLDQGAAVLMPERDR